MQNTTNKIILTVMISFALLGMTGCSTEAIGDAIGGTLGAIGDIASGIGNCIFDELILGCILN